MNLFKMLTLCERKQSETSRLPRQLVSFALVWLKTFSCVLNLLRETRFDNMRQLNFKCTRPGNNGFKLIVAAVLLTRRTTRSGCMCKCPQRDSILCYDIPLMNFKQPSERQKVSWRRSESETWILNDWQLLKDYHTPGTSYLWSANK